MYMYIYIGTVNTGDDEDQSSSEVLYDILQLSITNIEVYMVVLNDKENVIKYSSHCSLIDKFDVLVEVINKYIYINIHIHTYIYIFI
jgi:hypothetical protein